MPDCTRLLVVVDVETTGTVLGRDRILEIGACVVDPITYEVLDTFETRIRSYVPSTSTARRIHGLGDKELADAPSESEALNRFATFVGGPVRLAGNNICFDAAFLRDAVTRTGANLDIDYHLVDEWSVASVVLAAIGQELTSSTLDGLCLHFGIPRPEPHRALDDARATAGVLERIIGILATR